MARNKLDYEAMRSYKAQGHTHIEVAEKFGCSKRTSIQVCKGIAMQWNKHTEEDIAEYIALKLPGFEYVDGFKDVDSPVNIRCVKHGIVMPRSMTTIRHGKRPRCPECLKASKEQTRIRNEKKKESVRIRAERNRIIKRWSKSNTGKQIFMKSCKECGCLFHTWKRGDRYCSDACRHKVVNRYKDNRLNDSNIIDKDITLSKLYNRDDGKCYLCGCVCDWNDKAIDDNGTVIVGGSYPTIEHVYPLSKGGLHAWDNVRLACKSCNENKRNMVPPSENVS